MRLFSRRSDGGDGESPSFKRRNVLWAGLLALAVLLVYSGWLGFQALVAKTDLERAYGSAQRAKDALLDGKAADASRFAADAQSHAQAARNATHSVPWIIASRIPVLGSPFKTGQEISDVVLGLAATVLKPTADAGVNVAPNQLFANGQLDVKALRNEEPALREIAAHAARLNGDAQAVSKPHYLSVLSAARSQLQAQTSDIAELLSNTALAAKLAPALMGADGTRKYLMGFQTNAEARGTGGLLGGFGILRFENGKPNVETLGSNTALDGPFAPIALGSEFDEQYGFTNPTTDFKNSNQSSHFPYAAQIWKSMWEQQYGMGLDGVIAIDPIALSYILGATGSAMMPDGEELTENNVVELTESTVYRRFPTDQAARKRYLQDVAMEVVNVLAKPVKSPRKLLDALGKATSERRISVWSSAPSEQNLLEETLLAHVIPDGPAPYAEVVINNLGGNKMDYYLNRQIEYVADACTGNTRVSTVTVRLSNTVKDANALTDYVAGRNGFFPWIKADIPKGTMITSVRLLSTKDARLGNLLVDGRRTPTLQAIERGHPSFEAQVVIPPGQTAELAYQLSEPTTPGQPRAPFQPLIDNSSPVVSVPECS